MEKKPLSKTAPSAKKTAFLNYLNKWQGLFGLAGLLLSAIAILVAVIAIKRPEKKADEDTILAAKIQKAVVQALDAEGYNQLRDRVNEMHGQIAEMDPFVRMLVQREMGSLSKLNQTEFDQKIPEINAGLRAATAVKADIPESDLDRLRTRLLSTDRRKQDFWKSTLALVNYRSLPNQGASSQKNCFSELTNELYVIKPGTTTSFTGVPRYSNCTLNLDEPINLTSLKRFDGAPGITGPGIACVGCTVIYSGGEIPMASQGLRTIIFDHCKFELGGQHPPPISAQNLLFSLLSAPDFNKIATRSQNGI